LHLPDDLYERLRAVADDMQRPVEDVLLDSLALLFGQPPELTPEQLDRLSDAQLWAIVYRPLAWPIEAQIRALDTQSKAGRLTVDEQHKLDELIAGYDRYVLLRSEALVRLKRRGHDVEQRLKPGA